MMKKPKHVHGYIDRHGRARFYYRRKGCASIPLPGLPWSPQFMAAYEAAASSGQCPLEKATIGRLKPGSVKDVVNRYLRSLAFADLAKETQRMRRNTLIRFEREHGDKQMAKFERKHVEAMIGAMKAKRFAARNFLKTLRALMTFAVDDGLLKTDPTVGIKYLNGRTDGYATWSEEDICKFCKFHPLGSRERLALELLVCTAQRRSDVVRMGRQHVRVVQGGPTIVGPVEKAIDVSQQKTGAKLSIPIHPDLQAALDAMPLPSNFARVQNLQALANLTFLTTLQGTPFTPESFTNWFRKACDAAGLPKGLSAHGLRKAAARRLAEAGASTKIIAATTGHASLKEIERYTKAADQARMARQGMAILLNQKSCDAHDF